MNIDEKYKRAMIYTIRNIKDDTLIYVGSTINTLSKRFDAHKRGCKKGYTISLYNYIENNDWTDWYIELYEMYSCNNKQELQRREGQVIREIGTVNKNIAGRTKQEYKKEYREQNADKIKEKNKQYREENADKIKEKTKEWREQNADKIKEYYKQNADKLKERTKEWREQNADKKKEQDKEYREQNADKIKEYKKEYYEQNADKIKEYKKEWYEQNANKINESKKKYRENNKEKIRNHRTEKICCDICGALISRHNISKHQRTKTCLAIKNSNNTDISSDSHIADL